MKKFFALTVLLSTMTAFADGQSGNKKPPHRDAFTGGSTNDVIRMSIDKARSLNGNTLIGGNGKTAEKFERRGKGGGGN